jgi:hypothetical protein
MALRLLERLQKIYTFLCDNQFDHDTEKYIKYLAPLTYNQSINKDLVLSQPNVAMNLFMHGVKFYSKYFSNFYIVFDSIRIFEHSFLKNNQLEHFYQTMFDFIYTGLTDETCLNAIESSIDKKEPNAGGNHQLKQIYLYKMYLCLFVHFASVSYSNDLPKSTDKMVIEQYNKLKLCFINKKTEIKNQADLIKQSKEFGTELRDVENTGDVLMLIDLIFKHLSQFRKKTSVLSTLLKENSVTEKKIMDVFTKVIHKASEIDTFYQYWTVNNLFDLITATMSNFLTDPSTLEKYLQESLIDLLVTLAHFFSENVKV